MTQTPTSTMQPPTPPEEDVEIVDYFSFQVTDRFYFPDKVQWIEFQKMNEGAKKAYQDKTSKDLVLSRSGESRMTILQGSERHELIKACVIAWHVKRGDKFIDDDPTRSPGKVQFGDFLTLAPPNLIEDLEKAIRKANPWLLAEMKSSDIEREIENLTEMLEEAKKREAGEGN